jgi:hypothetical protein
MIQEFIKQQKEEIAQKLQAIKEWKKNNPDAPHEYEILNNAWVKGEENLLNKLEEWLQKK